MIVYVKFQILIEKMLILSSFLDSLKIFITLDLIAYFNLTSIKMVTFHLYQLHFSSWNQQMKKFLNNRHSTEPGYEDKCLEHLQHDFMVQQYLRQTTSIHNHQSYVNLLNQIVFNNKNKKRQITFLENQKRCFSSQSEHIQPPASTSFTKNYKFSDLIDFQKKIIEEQEIKINLHAELNEVSKSINLMKGDVSRIIETNESTIVLQKKTSKVKLIAQDQLKKVTVALQKDHSEILERNNMQMKFNKRLKNICNNQNSVLKKIKSDFLRLEQRKKSVNEKINKMEGIMKTLNEREKTRQEIKIINQRNRVKLEQIMNLYDLVKKIESQEEGKQFNAQQRDQTTLDSHLCLKTQRFKLKIKELQNQIINYICRSLNSIEKYEKQVKNSSQKRSQCKDTLQKLNKQQKDYQNALQNDGVLIVTEQEMRSYNHNLAKFKRILHLLLIIWKFIENHHDFTRLIDQSESNEVKANKKQSIISRFYRRSEEFHKNTSVVNEDNNYSNIFYKLIMYLTDNGEEINFQTQFVMKSLEMTIIMWLKGLKNLILEEKKLIPEHFNTSKSLQFLKFKATIDFLEELKEEQQKKYRLSLPQEQSDKLKTILELIGPKRTVYESQSENDHPRVYKQVKTEGDEECKAKRIKVLQKVEYDYYKMLKNVLQIEKQNIKKNYDFNKNFNRAKFTEKNILQEQKRFQSSFALEFIKKNEQSMHQSRRSIISKSSFREHLSKKRNLLHRTDFFSSFRYENESICRDESMKSRVKQNVFNASKLQRQSKLIERRSLQQPNNKSVRSSLFALKRPIINFADKALRQQYWLPL